MTCEKCPNCCPCDSCTNSQEDNEIFAKKMLDWGVLETRIDTEKGGEIRPEDVQHTVRVCKCSFERMCRGMSVLNYSI